MPGEELATWLLCLTAADLPGGATALARKLRENQTPVVGRIIEERVVLDPRTVLPIEDGALIQAISGVLSAMTSSMASD